jgi:hypothetical protein
MIGLPILQGLQRQAQRRVMLDTVAVGLPVALAAAMVVQRSSNTFMLAAIALAALIGGVFVAARRARRLNRNWLIGELDTHLPSFEDSSALLFQDPSASGALAALQRDRLEIRIGQAEMLDLRPDWSRRTIASAWALFVIVTAAFLLWPTEEGPPSRSAASSAGSQAIGPPRITAARLRIVPPAYTGLPPRILQTLSGRMPEGSRVQWSVTFDPSPQSATLAFPDDGPVRLAAENGQWSGARVVDRSMLYRIEAAGLARQPLNRLDVVSDAPPAVRIVAPESQLEEVRPGQTRWSPVFEASDDYQVADVASLRITVTKGDGENISYQMRSFAISGRGEARRKRFSATLNLSREGLAPGGDMIVQLVVSDNRAPNPQQVEGPSAILRWPAKVEVTDGLDGMAMRVMPAYFRSQRQIIIDAEALIRQRRKITPEAFLDRSDLLGHDQAQLRQRYGQHLGEENAGGGIALPTNDAPAAAPIPMNHAPPPPAAEVEAHDHTGEPQAPDAGQQSDTLATYGHAHDTGDATNLFDPGTRSTLSLALDAMWSSERALRQGEPEQALPFAYKALEFLKTAQQASRIFLPRTKSALPALDFSRRMSGKRDGIVADEVPAPTISRQDAVAAAAWLALQDLPGKPIMLRLDTLERWVRGSRARLPDPLALIGAIDAVRGDPNCLSCRRMLRAALWAALERPSASISRRAAPRGRGRRYLEALR